MDAMTADAIKKHDRVLDQTIEFETAVLSGILCDPELLEHAQEHISERDFWRAAHRLIFEAFLRLANRGNPIDVLSVKQVLTAEELEEVGGLFYLSTLLDRPKGMNVRFYAELVRGCAIRRNLAAVARKVLLAAETETDDPTVLLEETERALFALRDLTTQADVLTPHTRAAATFAQLETITAAHGALRGVPTGLRDLDADLRGLHPGNLVVVGARPSMGKTAIAMTIAINAAAETKRPALFFSLEMSADEMDLREVTMRARVDGWRLTYGRISDAEEQRLATAIQEMQDGGVHVVDAPELTVGQIRAIARRARAKHGLSVVLIDYVQLITAEVGKGRRQENRTLELSEITRALKGLARDLNVPVVLLSQLSRGVESRADKRPQLSDLRESGSLEQDADVVLLLFRPNAYEDLRRKAEHSDQYVECQIAKQRNGPTGRVKLAFIREHTRFDNYREDLA